MEHARYSNGSEEDTLVGDKSKAKIIFIVGPTAVGKTAVAISQIRNIDNIEI